MSFSVSHSMRDHSGAVYALAASGDGTLWSSAADRMIVQWDIASGIQRGFVVRNEAVVYALHIHQSSPYLLAGDQLGQVHIIDLLNKKEAKNLHWHQGGIFDIVCNNERSIAAFASADGKVSIWQINTWECIRVITVSAEKIRCLLFSDDNTYLFVGANDGNIYTFETSFWNEVNRCMAHANGVTSLCWHQEKNVLLSGGRDGHLRAWKTLSASEVMALPIHYYSIYGIALNLEANLIATCSRDKTIKIWNASDFSLLQKLTAHTHSVNRVLWQNDVLISCSDDRSIVVWKNS